MPTTKKNNLLEYKGHPLMRKENIIYYGSMSDSHIIMMQILESSDYKGLPVAKRVSVQLQQTDPNVRMKERIVKKTEKNSMWAAMDIASIWLGTFRCTCDVDGPAELAGSISGQGKRRFALPASVPRRCSDHDPLQGYHGCGTE